MTSASLRASLATDQARVKDREIAALRKQLSETVSQLAQARRTSAARRVSPAKSRTRLRGDRVRVCIPDTHGAKVAHQALASTLGDIKSLNPDEVILLGDHVDCGGFLAQHHTLGYVAETEYSYEDDIAATNRFLDTLQRVAPRAVIDYIEGNHERRVETWCVTQTLRHAKDSEMLRKAFAPEFLLDLAGRGIAYRRQSECYDGLHVPGIIRRGKCIFLHGISTAKHAAAVTAGRVAGNVVFAHSHRAQTDISSPLSVGSIGAWNPGCLCELQPLWNHTRPTDWTHGYAIQFISRTGKFLHLNVPILQGQSLFLSLFKK